MEANWPVQLEAMALLWLRPKVHCAKARGPSWDSISKAHHHRSTWPINRSKGTKPNTSFLAKTNNCFSFFPLQSTVFLHSEKLKIQFHDQGQKLTIKAPPPWTNFKARAHGSCVDKEYLRRDRTLLSIPWIHLLFLLWKCSMLGPYLWGPCCIPLTVTEKSLDSAI